MKLFLLGAEGWGKEGNALAARHSLPVVPQEAGGAAFTEGGVGLLKFLQKPSGQLRNGCFPKTQQPSQGNRPDCVGSQICELGELALLSEPGKTGCPVECVHTVCFILPGMYLKQIQDWSLGFVSSFLTRK